MSDLEKKLREIEDSFWRDEDGVVHHTPCRETIEILHEAAAVGAKEQRDKVPHLYHQPNEPEGTMRAAFSVWHPLHLQGECRRLGGRCAYLVTEKF